MGSVLPWLDTWPGWPTKEAVLTTNTSAKATLHQRALHEFKELAIISAYLYVTLGAVIMMKAAVLHTEGIAFTPWGIAIVKAVVLGKFVLLGNMAHVGGRDISGPLIWPTLRRAFAFLVLLVVLTIIEEVVVGLFHHQSIAASELPSTTALTMAMPKGANAMPSVCSKAVFIRITAPRVT
jgi:hypothetical protein